MAFFSQKNLNKEQVENNSSKSFKLHTTDDYILSEFLDFPQFSPEVLSDSLHSLRPDCWEDANQTPAESDNQMSKSTEFKNFRNKTSSVSVNSLMKFCFVDQQSEESFNTDVSLQEMSLPDDLSSLVFNTFDAFDYIEESGPSFMGGVCVGNDLHCGKFSSSGQCFGCNGGSLEDVDDLRACQGDGSSQNCHAKQLPSINCCSWSTDNINTHLASQNNRFETVKTLADEQDESEEIIWSNCSLITQQYNAGIPKQQSFDTATFSANNVMSVPSANAAACCSPQNSECISPLDTSSTALVGAVDYESENSSQTNIDMPELRGTRSAGNTHLLQGNTQNVHQSEDTESFFTKITEMSFVSMLKQTKLLCSTHQTSDLQNARNQSYGLTNTIPLSSGINTADVHAYTVQIEPPSSESKANSQIFSSFSDLQNESRKCYKLQNIMPVSSRIHTATEQDPTSVHLDQSPLEKAPSELFSAFMTCDLQNASSQCSQFKNTMPFSSRINTPVEHEYDVEVEQTPSKNMAISQPFSSYSDLQSSRRPYYEFKNMPNSSGINTCLENEFNTVNIVQTYSENKPSSQLFLAHSDLRSDGSRMETATVQDNSVFLEQSSALIMANSKLVSAHLTSASEHQTSGLHNASSQCFEFQNLPLACSINTATEHECRVPSPSENMAISQIFSAPVTGDLQSANSQCFEFQNMPTACRINTVTEHERTVLSASENMASSLIFSAPVTGDRQYANSQCYEIKNIMPLPSRMNTLTEQVCPLQSDSENTASSRIFSGHLTRDPQNASDQLYEFQNMLTTRRMKAVTEHTCTAQVEQSPSVNASSSYFSAHRTCDLHNPSSLCDELQSIMPISCRINTVTEHESTERAEQSSKNRTCSHLSDLRGSKDKKIHSLASQSKSCMKVGKRGRFVELPVKNVNEMMVRDLLSLSGNIEEVSMREMTEDFRNNKRRVLEQKLKRLNHINK